MVVCYNKLWKILIDKRISIAELRKTAFVSPNTMTKMCKDEMVSLGVLDRICDVLNADYVEIVEHVREREIHL